MPIHIMVVQGIIVSIISVIFLFMPSVSSSFWLLTDLAALVYLAVYIIMFLAFIKLRYSEPQTHRPYKVPGGLIGMWFFAGIGLVACTAAMILGLFPPSQVQIGSLAFYEGFLIIGFAIIFILPFIFYSFRRASWKKNIDVD